MPIHRDLGTKLTKDWTAFYPLTAGAAQAALHLHDTKGETQNNLQPAGLLPTFSWREEAIHLHAAAGMGNAESAAGDQTLLRRAALRGPHQAPAWPLTGPLQQLHCLPHLNAQLAAVARCKVLEHHS